MKQENIEGKDPITIEGKDPLTIDFTNPKECGARLGVDSSSINVGYESMQGTLEEVAERLYPDCSNVLRQMAKETFIKGAKWQQEQDRNVYLNGYVDGSREQAKLMYSEEDLECAWNSSDQNMRFQFSSSAYKGITFKQWLEKYEHER